MISLEQIKQQLLEGKQIEEIVENIEWQEFEKLVSEILEKHEFKSWNNFRFKTTRRYEIDIIATKNTETFLIDCKQWSTGRYKSSALKQATKHQEERLEEFQKFIKNNPIAKTKFRIKDNQELIPIIVTWYDEKLTKHGQAPIIPIWKLNEFLLSPSNYA
ncbi:MAG: NERD domain-containing protein [Candidatus Aenigmarchaeota archaeon]|nr:NERD domain-containing protein [Candidatus Aenigmarchaeota archaeon]